jgi:hypothetical protein
MMGSSSILVMVGVAGFGPARAVSLKQGSPLAPKASVSTSSTTPRLSFVCARYEAGAATPARSPTLGQYHEPERVGLIARHPARSIRRRHLSLHDGSWFHPQAGLFQPDLSARPQIDPATTLRSSFHQSTDGELNGLSVYGLHPSLATITFQLYRSLCRVPVREPRLSDPQLFLRLGASQPYFPTRHEGRSSALRLMHQARFPEHEADSASRGSSC